jgi:FixJ family two-component response regulator
MDTPRIGAAAWRRTGLALSGAVITLAAGCSAPGMKMDANQVARLQQRLDRLTQRERQVMEHVVAGLHNREIAQELGISPRTVEVYKARMMDKLDVQRVADLVKLAVSTMKSR